MAVRTELYTASALCSAVRLDHRGDDHLDGARHRRAFKWLAPFGITTIRHVVLHQPWVCFELDLNAIPVCPPNDTLNQLQAASRASGDAARPLPRLTKELGGSELQRT